MEEVVRRIFMEEWTMKMDGGGVGAKKVEGVGCKSTICYMRCYTGLWMGE